MRGLLSGKYIKASSFLLYAFIVNLSMVGHLYLRQVEILCAAALRLERNGVLDKGRLCRVDRWEQVGQLRFGSLFLVVRLGN